MTPAPAAPPLTVKLDGTGVTTGPENATVKLMPPASAVIVLDLGAELAAVWAATTSATGTTLAPPSASMLEIEGPLAVRKAVVSAGSGSSSTRGEASSAATSASGKLRPDASTTLLRLIPRPPAATGVTSRASIAVAVPNRV